MKCCEGKCTPECRYYIDYPEDDNCALVAIDKHGAMTLREVAKRMQISFVRVKQIEDAAMAKLAKRLSADSNLPLSELKSLLHT
ncbi:MAG: sigma factor-like helix-turn-helix DNA-binding protein [Actinomycetota bacterium]|jgi:hypothetical protein|nr:sigma factor-like helix-turn-helix DNA-binding protein [Actinomycetota bacterium]|tara:strand:+ start:530 stop:781 length:252 start_codon:yes stop_codon:yes gene_type:complete